MAKDTKKVDRRILRTRKAISDAFDTLAIKGDFNKITVSTIAREADIDRKTFYLHYSSIEDLIRSRTEKLLELFVVSIIKHGNIDSRRERLHAIFTDFNKVVEDNLELYTHLVASLSTDQIMMSLGEAMSPILHDAGLKNTEAEQIDFAQRALFCLSGTIAVYRAWLLSDHEVPLATITGILEDEFDTDSFPEMNILAVAFQGDRPLPREVMDAQSK